jgi:hypothetical protein
MAVLNFEDQWDAVVAYFDSSASATALAALAVGTTPRPPANKGQPEKVLSEDRLKPWAIAIDILSSEHAKDRDAGAGRHQQWATVFRVYVSARGTTDTEADSRCLEVISAICNDLAGLGNYVGTDRTTIIRAAADRFSWDVDGQDSIISTAFVDVTADFYRF